MFQILWLKAIYVVESQLVLVVLYSCVLEADHSLSMITSVCSCIHVMVIILCVCVSACVCVCVCVCVQYHRSRLLPGSYWGQN